jgi:4-oxalocrotonate tautomerase
VPAQELSDITSLNKPLTARLVHCHFVSSRVSTKHKEALMPEVVVYILEGRTLEQKRGLVKDITAAVVKNANTTPEQVTVSLVETAKNSKGKGGVLFSEMPARQ